MGLAALSSRHLSHSFETGMLATQTAYLPRQPVVHKVTSSAPRPPAVPKVQSQPSVATVASIPVAPIPVAIGSLCRHVHPIVKAASEPSDAGSSHFALGVRWSLRLASAGSAKRRKVRPNSMVSSLSQLGLPCSPGYLAARASVVSGVLRRARPAAPLPRLRPHPLRQPRWSGPRQSSR